MNRALQGYTLMPFAEHGQIQGRWITRPINMDTVRSQMKSFEAGGMHSASAKNCAALDLVGDGRSDARDQARGI